MCRKASCVLFGTHPEAPCKCLPQHIYAVVAASTCDLLRRLPSELERAADCFEPGVFDLHLGITVGQEPRHTPMRRRPATLQESRLSQGKRADTYRAHAPHCLGPHPDPRYGRLIQLVDRIPARSHDQRVDGLPCTTLLLEGPVSPEPDPGFARQIDIGTRANQFDCAR